MTISEDLSVYEDVQLLERQDLIVHSWSGGTLTAGQEQHLVDAVEAGVGFAGWHGGVIGTNVANARYLRMVGGRFLWHPDGLQRYTVNVVPDPPRDAAIVAGLTDFAVETEQYWVLADDYNTVLATTRFDLDSGAPWDRPVDMPVTWTRRWARGRVFVCVLGHRVADLKVPETTTMIERGLLWAARRDPR
ncbi:ThuA domain-containing protein [Micromonospora vulcania]